MDILLWVDKNINDIKQSVLFGKYFDTINMEQMEDVYFFANPEYGIDLILTAGLLVKSIHLFGERHNGIKRFPDKLLLNIDFSFSRTDVRNILGLPKETGGGGQSFLYENVPDWDKYLFQDYSLHFQYQEDAKRIDLITIGSVH